MTGAAERRQLTVMFCSVFTEKRRRNCEVEMAVLSAI
jgi:hypothetical protein